jgi:hypothetical protein
MDSNFQKLLEGSVLNEETKTAILEAWENKISEAREEVAIQLREEFAQRYEMDKNRIAEAAEKMIKDSLKKELEEFATDKAEIKKEKKAVKNLKEQLSNKVFDFIKPLLKEEVGEFRTERKSVNESLMKLQSFVKKQLNEELAEFSKDRTALITERVNFEKEKTKKLNEAKKVFIESATKTSEKIIREALYAELKQLRADLKESKQKMFGAKLFEAFAAEFMNSHYNENKHIKQMTNILESTKKKVSVLEENLKNKDIALTEARKAINVQTELRERNEILTKLTAPLEKNQRKIMTKLLESTETKKLEEGFKKYLPSILNESSSNNSKHVLTESDTKVSYDGNRQPLPEEKTDDDTTKRLRILSGISKF